MKAEETTCGVTREQLESLHMKVLRFVRELEAIKAPATGGGGGNGGSMRGGSSFADKVRRFEKRLIEAALVETAGRQRRAAKLLGVKMSTLHAKIKRYGLTP